jgi:intracellular septation protein A
MWRIALLIYALSFVIPPVGRILLEHSTTSKSVVIFYHPVVASWLFAIYFWLSGAASTSFVRLMFWGERLGLTDNQWLYICRVLAAYCVVIGLINGFTAQLLHNQVISEVTWVDVKIFAPAPLLVVTVIFLAFRLPYLHDQSKQSSA